MALNLARSSWRADDAAEAVALRAAVRALPVDQREALVLRHVVGLSAAEAAEAAGVSPDALRARCHRGAVELRRLLNAD